MTDERYLIPPPVLWTKNEVDAGRADPLSILEDASNWWKSAHLYTNASDLIHYAEQLFTLAQQAEQNLQNNNLGENMENKLLGRQVVVEGGVGQTSPDSASSTSQPALSGERDQQMGFDLEVAKMFGLGALVRTDKGYLPKGPRYND